MILVAKWALEKRCQDILPQLINEWKKRDRKIKNKRENERVVVNKRFGYDLYSWLALRNGQIWWWGWWSDITVTYVRRFKSWQQHPTRHQLYGHLPPITKTIQVRRTRHAGHCWRSRDELIRDVLFWIPTHGRAKAGRPARTYIQQLCEDTGCCPEDLGRWTIGRSGERGSGISVLPARYDDDDDVRRQKGQSAQSDVGDLTDYTQPPKKLGRIVRTRYK